MDSENKSEEEARTLLNEYQDYGKFTVLLLDKNEDRASVACIVPLVAFEPDDSGRCELFFWDSRETPEKKVINDVARLSDKVAERWRVDFFSEIVLPGIEAQNLSRHSSETTNGH